MIAQDLKRLVRTTLAQRYLESFGLLPLIRAAALAVALAGVVAHAATQQALLIGLVLAALVVFAVAWVRE